MSCEFCSIDLVAALGLPLLANCKDTKYTRTHHFHEHCVFMRISTGENCAKEGCGGKITHVNGKTVETFKKEVEAKNSEKVPEEQKADFDEWGSQSESSDADISDAD